MANECAGCEARQDEIRHLRAQVLDLTDRAMAAANPQLHLHLKNPSAMANSPAITTIEDGMGNPYVLVDGKAVPFRDWQRLLQEKGGHIVEDVGGGRFVTGEEYEATLAQAQQIIGGNAPTQ